MRVDVPHNIVVNDNPRWAISVRFNMNSEIHSWEDTLEHYKQFLVEENNANS